MATIARTTWTDGSTVINNARLQAIYDAIDTALRAVTTVTPATITADQNNYNPTGLSTAQFMRLSSDASRTITGIAAQAGRRLILSNDGANNIVLAHQSASSTSTNRLDLPGSSNLTLQSHDRVELVYDDAAGFWVALARA